MTQSKNDGAATLRIDLASEQDLAEWATKLDASPQQIREAVQAVGDRASDVEQHLKGSRSTTTGEQTHAEISVGTH